MFILFYCRFGKPGGWLNGHVLQKHIWGRSCIEMNVLEFAVAGWFILHWGRVFIVPADRLKPGVFVLEMQKHMLYSCLHI